jgi:hypothetical protein
MGKKQPGRAVLLNKEWNRHTNDKKANVYIKEFMKTNDVKKITTPPTQYEKALIVQEPRQIGLRSPRKIILPEFVDTKPVRLVSFRRTIATKKTPTATKKTPTTTKKTPTKTKKTPTTTRKTKNEKLFCK